VFLLALLRLALIRDQHLTIPLDNLHGTDVGLYDTFLEKKGILHDYACSFHIIVFQRGVLCNDHIREFIYAATLIRGDLRRLELIRLLAVSIV
jgi:hypothetical protein